MKLLLLLLMGIVMIGSAQMEARPIDFATPNNAFGAANPYGYLRIWREIEEIDYGNGLRLPLRLEFSSQYEKPSPYLGKGWSCPLLESKVYMVSEKLMAARLPCGMMMYLRKDGKDATKFFTMNKEWTAKIEEEKITISRNDGWELRYVNGRLRQMRTDQKRILTWVSRGDLISEIREEGKPVAPFRVQTTSKGVPVGFMVAGKTHTFELGKRPKVESTNGIRVVGGFDSTLTKWKWPDGRSEAYEFAVDEKVMPTLNVTNTELQAEKFSWNPATKHIVSDGEWTYRVGKMTKESTAPRLSRSNAKGEEEFLFITTKLGTTERKSLNGGHTITEVFKSVGPLYEKVRSVQKITDTGELQPLYKASYDEMGRMIREVSGPGLVKIISYEGLEQNKKVVVLPQREESMLGFYREREAAIRKNIDQAPTEVAKQQHLKLLALFYLNEMHDHEKALAMLPQITDRHNLYTLKLFLLSGNSTMPEAQKTAAYQQLVAEFPESAFQLEWLMASPGERMKNAVVIELRN